MKLEGKVAVVTGGGDGIGRKTAVLLAEQGAKVIVTDIDEPSGAATVKEILKAGGDAIFVPHNMNNNGDWHRVVEAALSAYNKIDMLFNNAGLYKIHSISDASQRMLSDSLAIQLKHICLGVKHLTSANEDTDITMNDLPIAGIVGRGHTLQAGEAVL